MVFYSVGVHSLLLVALFLVPSLFYRPLVDAAQSTSTMNVMWAETVTGPPATVEHKLPGPMVPIPEAKAPADQEPKYTLDTKSNAPSKNTLKKDPSPDRKKQMKDALASLGLPEDDRPVPKLDNFQSMEGAEKQGLPGSPFGGGSGKLAGDPEFAKYKMMVQKITYKNFVWIRPESNLRAEVVFKLSQDGSILNPTLKKSSGNAAYDNAAMRAVLKSSPLPDPPEKFRNQVLQEYFIVIFDPRLK